MAEDMLTFELSPGGEEIHIHGSPSGLRRLAATLERLASSPRSDHDHLAAPEWAGSELSSDSQGGKVVRQVTIHCWID